MKPTKRLILALRETAQELRTRPEKYEWSESERCNCGLLARSLGMQDKDVRFLGSWTIQANTYFCKITGQPLTKMFKFLCECGLEQGDFAAIEHCGYDPLHVAKWMDQKADELERRRVTEREDNHKFLSWFRTLFAELHRYRATHPTPEDK